VPNQGNGPQIWSGAAQNKVTGPPESDLQDWPSLGQVVMKEGWKMSHCKDLEWHWEISVPNEFQNKIRRRMV
jgi:hypothetical protein